MTDPQERPGDMDEGGSVSVWLDGVRNGASTAQQAIWSRYLQRLVNYADHRLRQLGVRAEDGDDIAQKVFAGFFRRAQAGQFPQLEDRDDLWRVLVVITNDRVIDVRRKKRPATESAMGKVQDNSANTPAIEQVVNNGPSPELGCEVVESMRELMNRMDRRHPALKQIAALRLEGYTVQEIAEKLGTPKRTIERRLEWILEIWDRYRSEP